MNERTRMMAGNNLQPRRVGLYLNNELAGSLRLLGLEPEPSDGSPQMEPISATQITCAIHRYAQAVVDANRELERMLDPEEWNYLAYALSGCDDIWDLAAVSKPYLALVREYAEYAHSYERAGDKYFKTQGGDEGVRQLLTRLNKLSSIHADAIVAAVRYHWAYSEIHPSDHRWFSVAARLPKCKEERHRQRRGRPQP
jgi:hypothetical protein